MPVADNAESYNPPMPHIIVEGGHRLSGSIAPFGAKNAALKEMVATILADGRHRLRNVPGIIDVELMCDVLSHLGATCHFEDHVLDIDMPAELVPEAPLELVRAMRASIVVMGPLLARFGSARVAFPGGDDLGARPIDMHVSGLQAMGAEFELEHGVLHATAPGGLSGATIDLDFPSVGATENVLFAAVIANGTTTINNAAREPEIEDLCAQLTAMGAKIEGAGTAAITVHGVEALVPADHQVVADRLEAGTYAVAAAITGGELEVEQCNPHHLRMELSKLIESGCEVEQGDDWFRIAGPERPLPVDVATLPYPGFHTDMQPQMVSMLALADGTSVVTENLYDARFRFVGELARMGADITTEWQHAIIRGVDKLSGCPVLAFDIRAGAALVLAGLAAEGETIVGDVHHIDRGYEDFAGRLAGLGAVVTRAED